MNSATILLYVLSASALIALLIIIINCVKLIALRRRFKRAFTQIDEQLQRRYAIIPQLVETAAAYLASESESDILESVLNARNAAAAAILSAADRPGDPTAMRTLVAREDELTCTLERLFSLYDTYPDLKANPTMLNLTEEMTSAEYEVCFSRQSYNDRVMIYNTERENFPTNLIASTFNFTASESFGIENPEQWEPDRVPVN